MAAGAVEAAVLQQQQWGPGWLRVRVRSTRRCVLRASWLRALGEKPKKAQCVSHACFLFSFSSALVSATD